MLQHWSSLCVLSTGSSYNKKIGTLTLCTPSFEYVFHFLKEMMLQPTRKRPYFKLFSLISQATQDITEWLSYYKSVLSKPVRIYMKSNDFFYQNQIREILEILQLIGMHKFFSYILYTMKSHSIRTRNP